MATSTRETPIRLKAPLIFGPHDIVSELRSLSAKKGAPIVILHPVTKIAIVEAMTLQMQMLIVSSAAGGGGSTIAFGRKTEKSKDRTDATTRSLWQSEEMAFGYECRPVVDDCRFFLSF